MKKKFQVDRFEGEIAVLYDGEEEYVNVLRGHFGFELHDGDILEVTFEGGVPISAVFLAEETEATRQKIRILMEKLKKKKRRE